MCLAAKIIEKTIRSADISGFLLKDVNNIMINRYCRGHFYPNSS